MRALKIAIVVMTVLILGGTATLVVLIAKRLSPGPTLTAAQVELQEAPGSRIVGMAAAGDRLVLRLQGGGPDRVVIYDLRDLRRLGRIALAP